MDKDRPVQIRHHFIQRHELGRIQWLAVDIGIQFDCPQPKVLDRSLGLFERGINVIHGQSGDPGRKPVGVFQHQLGQFIIGHATQLRRNFRRSDGMDRRRSHRNNLDVLIGIVHYPEAGLKIHQGGNGFSVTGGVQGNIPVRDLFFQHGLVSGRQNVGIGVNNHSLSPTHGIKPPDLTRKRLWRPAG